MQLDGSDERWNLSIVKMNPTSPSYIADHSSLTYANCGDSDGDGWDDDKGGKLAPFIKYLGYADSTAHGA